MRHQPALCGVEEPGIEQGFPGDVRTKETPDLFLVLIQHILKVNGRAALVLPDGTLFGEGVKTRIKEQLLSECVQPAHHRSPDQRRVCALHRHQDQFAVFHQGHTHAADAVSHDPEQLLADYARLQGEAQALVKLLKVLDRHPELLAEVRA
jgi:hypothetical protein